MADSLQSKKTDLRKEKLRLRRELDASFRCYAHQVISRTLEALPEYQSASVIAAYASDGTEVDLTELLRKSRREGKTICFPRWRNQDSAYEMAVADESLTLVEGKWKMPEPPPEAPRAAQELLDHALWLIPGVAFDEHCGRLGRGKGIYDRLLACSGGFKAGIFYQCQKTADLPMEDHDEVLDLVVTEEQVIRRK